MATINFDYIPETKVFDITCKSYIMSVQNIIITISKQRFNTICIYAEKTFLNGKLQNFYMACSSLLNTIWRGICKLCIIVTPLKI